MRRLRLKMKDYRVSLRYAQALFALAEESGEIFRVEEELAETKNLVEKHREISHLLMNTTISLEEKEDFIQKVLPESFSRLTVNFLKVLIRKKRFRELGLIQEKFHDLYEEKKGIQRVRVLSAVPLSEILQEKLRLSLQRRLNCKIYLETSTNPEIIGGLVLDFKGVQIDASYRTALFELKQKLLHPVR